MRRGWGTPYHLETVPTICQGFLALLTTFLTPPDHQKLCYSALVLAMVFSMGEAVPYAHYGKNADG